MSTPALPLPFPTSSAVRLTGVPPHVRRAGRDLGAALAGGAPDETVYVAFTVRELTEFFGHGAAAGVAGEPEVLRIGDLAIDLPSREVFAGSRPVTLTRREFDLLAYLVRHPGRVFTREALLAAVWVTESSSMRRTVDIHVRRIRAKLGPLAPLVETIFRVGYRIRAVP